MIKTASSAPQGESIDAAINAAVQPLTDELIFVVAIPNLLGRYIMAPVIKQDLQVYWTKRLARLDAERAAS